MTEVSCLYIHYNRSPINFTFIKYYNDFYKIILNYRSIIVSNSTLLDIPHVLDYYIISLITTKHTVTGITKIDNIYNISVKYYWKRLYFLDYYSDVELSKNNHKNPLNSKKPTRESSNKKINKFFKYYERELLSKIDNELDRCLYLYLRSELNDIEYDIITLQNKCTVDKYINILTSIKKYYGKDIYDYIRIKL